MPNPGRFKFIRHWGEYLGQTEEEITALQEQADAADAPEDAIYHNSIYRRPMFIEPENEVNGGWRTINDVEDTHRFHFIERGIMSKKWRKL